MYKFCPLPVPLWAKTEPPIPVDLPKEPNSGDGWYSGIDKPLGNKTSLHNAWQHLLCKTPPIGTVSARLRILFLLAVYLGRELVQHVYHFRWALNHSEDLSAFRDNMALLLYEAKDKGLSRLDDA